MAQAQVFRPVKSTEEKLFDKNNPISPEEGYLYFTTDTKKIYLGNNGEYLPMGGNSGVYYGNRIPAEGEEDIENITFQFELATEIEGDNAPNVDDLILNIPDGCFYRVTAVNEDVITADKLTIAGSGGGGGSGGSTISRPVINGLFENSKYFSSAETDNMKINFTCISQMPENNYINAIEYNIGSHSFRLEGNYAFGEVISIDLSQHLDIISTQMVNNLTLQVFDVFGNSSYKTSTFGFYVISLSLETDQESIISVNKGKSYAYTYTPVGGNISNSGSNISRYVDIVVTPLDNPDIIIYEGRDNNISSMGMQQQWDIPFYDTTNYDFEHGVYLLKATYCVEIKSIEKVIKSNVLQHQVAYIDPEEATPLIATSFIDNETIPQYTNYSMKYMIAQGDGNGAIKVSFQVENDIIIQDTYLNTISTWTYPFVEIGTYQIKISYEDEKKALGSLTVVEYSSDDIPTINTQGIELQLSPLGKSNNQSNKDEWISNYQGKEYQAKFENFLWGNENGWTTEDDGPCLKLTNGAKLSIPDYRPFQENATKAGFTIEITFKLSNISDYKKALISCLSPIYGDDGSLKYYNAGFQITGEKATLNSSAIHATTGSLTGNEDDNGNADESDAALSAFTQYFGEDTKIHLTYVIEKSSSTSYTYIYTYLNGVLSGIKKRDNDNFQDDIPAIIEIDSTYGDIYLYGIRTYRTAINHRVVINNYIADISDINEKIELTKQNNVFDTQSRISKKAIEQLATALGVRYCIFEGGYRMDKKFTIPYTFTKYDKEQRRLPRAKNDFHLMSLSMYEKSDNNDAKKILDVPIVLNDGTIDVDGENIEIGKEYTFKRGVQVYGQGTSSMVYPVKNLRLKFINEQDYPTVYNGSFPVEIVCFKADYMDSSSTHNTCTGNLVYDLYKALNLKTPPQEFGSDYDIVTAIRGFPIICFYRDYDRTDDDPYTYIGRYNFNLDKATPEPFGFKGMYKYTGRQTSTGRKEVEACGLRTEEVEGMKVLPLDENGNELEDDGIIQCWEFKNNDTKTPTKFLTPDGYTNYEEALISAWPNWYEDRYPDKFSDMGAEGTMADPEAKKALEDGLFRMSKWVNSTATTEVTNNKLEEEVYYLTLDKDAPTEGVKYYNAEHIEQELTLVKLVNVDTNFTGEEGTGIDKENVSVNIDTFANNSSVNGELKTYTFSYDGSQWALIYIMTDGEDNNITITENNISLSDFGISLNNNVTAIEGQSIIVELYQGYKGWTPSLLYEKHELDNVRYRLAKFKNEFTEYFNMDFCLFYYILTLVLLMMDSRAKNMMMASWDLKTWYPIFYDMDTILGLNNTGVNKFGYDTEDDPSDRVFNGYDSVLWNNFKEVFTDEIVKFYNQMRDSDLTTEKLLDTYNTDGADAFNEALTTMDAIYKYERPWEEGYYDGANNAEKAPGSTNFLYAAQGRRSAHRTWWIKNRINYLDSKYRPLSYGDTKPSSADAFSFRAYSIPKQKGDTQTAECVDKVPPDHRFNITALSNSYQSLFIGNITYGPVYAAAGQTVTIGSATPKHEVESYILNPSLIKDLGDLSNKYIGSWQMPKNKLTKLSFGQSSRSHPETYTYYFNSLLTDLSLGDSVNGSIVPYLQELNVARCTGLKGLNLSACSRLQVLDAEGCAMHSIVFPENSVLQELYLPNTIGDFELSDQPYLTTIVFDELDLDNVEASKLPPLTSFQMINVPNYDSYKLAKAIFNSRKNSLNTLYYVLTNVNWTINYDEKTNVSAIEILDDLKNYDKLKPADGWAMKDALTGTITLKGNIVANEYDLYALYKPTFRNLTINFEAVDSSQITKAPVITFMSNEKGAEDNQAHYQVLTDKTMSLATLISKSGPLGNAMVSPKKSSTDEYTYEFTKRWISNTGETYAETEENKIENDDILFTDAIPREDLTLYPIYNVQKKKYAVTFYDYNKKIIYQIDEEGTSKDSWEVEYGSVYDGPIKNFYYRSDFDLTENERYKFEGWSKSQGDNATYIDLSSYIITRDLNLYAHYSVEDVSNPSPEEYFKITFETYKLIDFGQSGTQNVLSDYPTISINKDYADTLQGKITIPKSINGTMVKSVGNFAAAKLITQVYFEDGNEITVIAPSAFVSSTKRDTLKKIELPTSVKYIGSSAFQNQAGLETVQLNNNITHIGNSAFQENDSLCLTALPEALQYLGSSAFQDLGPNFRITKLPDNLQELATGVFSNSRNVRISGFGEDNSKLQQIGARAFRFTKPASTSDDAPIPTTITFGKTIKTFGANCFDESYINEMTSDALIKFGNNFEDYNNGQFSELKDFMKHLGITLTNVDIQFGKETEASL